MVEVTLRNPTEIASLGELGRQANKLANAKNRVEKRTPLETSLVAFLRLSHTWQKTYLYIYKYT